MHRAILTVVLTAAMLLPACGSRRDPAEGVTAARSGIAAAYRIRRGAQERVKPSAALGLFASTYLAQGNFAPVSAASQGIEAQTSILAGQREPATGETFALLSELGSLLQVDVADLLNRSQNRSEALTQFSDSLRGVGSAAFRKYRELQVRHEELTVQRSDERTVLQSAEKELRDALRREDYAASAGLQERQTQAKSALSETESRLDQITTIMRRYEHLIDIARQRLHALEQNREILLAGLRVVEVPGIGELDILEEGSALKRLKRTEGGGTDIFGREKIYEE